MRRRRRLSLYRDIIRQRLEYLHKLAVEAARRGDTEHALKIGKYMKNLAMRAGVRMPRHIKRSICKRCGLPLIPGVTARIRLRSQGGMSYVVVTCNRCGWIHRYPYRKGVGHGGRKPESKSEEDSPRKPGRDNRQERSDPGGS